MDSMDLLLEIGTEEIPAKFMPAALAQLASIAKTKLDELGVPHGQIKTAGTPRRLTLIVHGVALRQNDKHTENKGPAVKIAFDDKGNPSKAALGFARGQGIDAKDLVVKDGYVYAVLKEPGVDVRDLLPALLPDIISSLTFPKTMRWGDLDMRFVRPIRSVLALFDGNVVPFSIAGVKSGNTTNGHRFLGKKEIVVSSVEDYFAKLKENYVIVDQDLRRQTIIEQIQNLASSHGGTADIDAELLEEVIFLVEYPTAILGQFDEKYLALPPDAVITPMREHQRYFPIKNKGGALLPMFITVRCGGTDYLDTVRRGNERVLRARLADAQFFFEEDQKTRLVDRVETLKDIVFQEGLGSVYDKTLRLVALTEYLGQVVNASPTDIETAKRSAYLAKADLSTNMVGEFSELQGIMGKEYSLLEGETPQVAEAILEHYLPRFAGDALAASTAGRLTGIADKTDNIIATFSRGLVPTGSQDPYALRRQALGIVHTLIDAKYSISLAGLLDAAFWLLKIDDSQKRRELSAAIVDFFRLRLKNMLGDENIRYDVVDAVLATGSDDVYDTYLKAKALAQFVGEGKDASVSQTLQALTRVGNLAKQAKGVSAEVKPALFAVAAEEELYKAYCNVSDKVGRAVREKDYLTALRELLSLTGPINGFFEAVMVMVDDEAVKQNRLALLGGITGLSADMADLGKLV